MKAATHKGSLGTKRGPIARADYLVRGIDQIPDDWEMASGLRTMRGLYRSRTVLKRLIGNAVNERQAKLARDLRGILTAVEHAVRHETGGFVIREIEPEAAKVALARRRAYECVDRLKRQTSEVRL
jgi:hypothetical protein